MNTRRLDKTERHTGKRILRLFLLIIKLFINISWINNNIIDDNIINLVLLYLLYFIHFKFFVGFRRLSCYLQTTIQHFLLIAVQPKRVSFWCF